ncbi:hypothetical protein QAD02_023415 [Eretmocerus hayati]|uniref:Uncharacterized protein n=1 Tax=Eretmocerus hayati TaxID=131215 RepID=A0ACC2PVR1_9HYME|nr:hypothetical protein QAD02_023415 [Eretmocerus hayati]
MPGLFNGSNTPAEEDNNSGTNRRFGVPVHEQCRAYSQSNQSEPLIGLTLEQEQLLTHKILTLTGPYRHLTLSEMQQIAFKFLEDRRISTDFFAEVSAEKWFQDFLDKNPILYSRAEGTHEGAASQNVNFDDPREDSSTSYENFNGVMGDDANDTTQNPNGDLNEPEESASYTCL